ncbi:MAG: 2-hydroxyacid dehydrogenase [Thermomicrobiales bacterium]
MTDKPHIKVVVWDNIGNTVFGMQPWDAWSEAVHERLLIEDPDARAKVVSIAELFPDVDLEVKWLYDPVKSRRGFAAFIDSNAEWLVPIEGPETIIRETKDADFFIHHKEMLPPEAVEGAGKLKLIQHLGKDYRGVPMAAAQAKGIPVAATALVNYSAVAEHVWAQILTHVKRMPEQREYMASGAYQQEWGAYHPGVTLLSDLTLGLVGMGEIGRGVARAAAAFDMTVRYWDIVRFPDLEEKWGLEFVDWETLWSESDIITTQLALNEHTQGIIGAKEFAMMKPTGFFINTARGRLVDETALVAALQEGRIAGAALDVYYDEPLPLESPLHALHNARPADIILTPHSAAQGPWTWIRDSQDLWFNIRLTLDGQPIAYRVG